MHSISMYLSDACDGFIGVVRTDGFFKIGNNSFKG